MKGSTRLAAGAALLLLGVSAEAAKINIEAFAIASGSAFTDGGAPCTVGVGNGVECERVVQASLGNRSDPTRYAADAAQHFEFYSNNVPTTEPPNFLYESSAQASGALGELHAFAGVHIVGYGQTPGATNIAPASASARARVTITDDIDIISSTLAIGTPVTLNALLEISGSGPGELTLVASGGAGGTGLTLKSIGLFNKPLSDLEGTLETKVGSRVHVEYSLMANMLQTINGWSPIDTLNGRANVADYGNSAHLYFGLADPSMNVQLKGLGGFSYAFPTAVPLPAAWLLFGSALLAGSGVGRRRPD